MRNPTRYNPYHENLQKFLMFGNSHLSIGFQANMLRKKPEKLLVDCLDSSLQPSHTLLYPLVVASARAASRM